MHIVYLTNEYPKKGVVHGGVGTFVHTIAQKLVAKGIKVSVVGINNEFIDEEELVDGIKIYRIKKSSWKFAKFIQNSRNILKLLSEIHKKEPIHIVEGAELSFAFFPKQTPYKKVIRIHGGHHFFTLELNQQLSKWKAFQEKRSFKIADHFITVSKYVGSQTQKYLNYNFEYTTIYNSVDIDTFKETSLVASKKNSLLFVGTVCEKKGIRQLLMALPYINEQFPDVTLTIAGRDWFFKNGDSYMDYLKAFISDDLKPHINFLGTIEHTKIPKLLEEAEVCVYPSHMESFGLTLIEAMALGKPIVFSNIPPFMEIITHEVSGLVCNPHDSKDIADKIIKLLLDSKKAIALGGNAKAVVNTKFNADIILTENINFYSSII